MDNKYFDFTDKIECIRWYEERLLNRTLTMFRYAGLPDSLPEKEVEKIVQVNGEATFAKYENEVYAFNAGPCPPYNVYYKPCGRRVVNPWIQNGYEPKDEYIMEESDESVNGKLFLIGKDCEIIKNDPLTSGLMPIIHKYAVILTEIDLTWYNVLIAMRAQYQMLCESDDEKIAADLWLKNLIDGKLTSIKNDEKKFTEDSNGGIKTNPYSQASSNYISQMIEAKQYWLSNFYQEIGLNSNYNMKREKISSDEIGLNEDVLRPLIDSMLEERQKGWDKVNKMFGLNVTVEFNSSWSKYNPTEDATELLGDLIDDTTGPKLMGDDTEEISTVETEAENTEGTEESTDTAIKITEEIADAVIDKLIDALEEAKDEDSEEETETDEDKIDNATPED